MAAHTYWRLNVAATDGGSTLNVAEIELRTAVGGANVATGAHGDVLDSSSYNKAVGLSGTAVRSATRAKWNTKSLYLDGSGAYLALPSSTDWNFGTGDFTVEMWAYPLTTTKQAIFGGTTDNQFQLYCRGGGNADLDMQYVSGITTQSGVTQNAWNHIIVSRTGTTLYVGVNGTATSVTNSTNFSFSNAPTPGINGHGSDNFNGYIDDLRVTKGVGRLSSTSYTVPSAQFADSVGGDASFASVVLLTHFEDLAAGTVLTSTGTTGAQAFDGSNSTNWAATLGMGWISYQFGTAQDIVEHAVTAPSATMTNAPKNWTLQYSDDGLNWTSASIVGGQTGWTSNEKRVFTHSTYPASVGVITLGAQLVAFQQTPPAFTTHATLRMDPALQPAKMISGTVKENGTNVARTVRAYCRLTGEILGEAISNASTGAFSINARGRTDYCYVVALDDLGIAPDYNAVIFDLVIPV